VLLFVYGVGVSWNIRRKFDFSRKMGLSDDFAERVSGFREAAGPQYRE
jgi:hypothetical protein